MFHFVCCSIQDLYNLKRKKDLDETKEFLFTIHSQKKKKNSMDKILNDIHIYSKKKMKKFVPDFPNSFQIHLNWISQWMMKIIESTKWFVYSIQFKCGCKWQKRFLFLNSCNDVSKLNIVNTSNVCNHGHGQTKQHDIWPLFVRNKSFTIL